MLPFINPSSLRTWLFCFSSAQMSGESARRMGRKFPSDNLVPRATPPPPPFSNVVLKTQLPFIEIRGQMFGPYVSRSCG